MADITPNFIIRTSGTNRWNMLNKPRNCRVRTVSTLKTGSRAHPRSHVQVKASRARDTRHAHMTPSSPVAPSPGQAAGTRKPNGRARLTSGLSAFYFLGFGQFFSIFTSSMVGFGISLWAWDLTGKATALVLVGVAGYIPRAILSPLAGTLVDRWNRKLVLAISDLSAACGALALLVLFYNDSIQIWHLYVIGAFNGIFGAFQYPAYMAVIPTMVPKEHLPRANSLRTITQSASGVGAPLLAGAVIGWIQIEGILFLDLITFAIAFAILLLVHIPQPRHTAEGQASKGTVWQETLYGFRYLVQRENLLAIFLLFTFSNIATGFGYPLMTPMILAKTGNDAVILGFIRSVGSAGFLAGGLLMSIWGGPKKRIHGVNIGFIIYGLFGALVFGTAWSLPLWLVGAFFMSLPNPVINASYFAILQSKVPPDLQGRIFGLDFLVTTITFPLGQLAAGLLSDHVFEPGFASGGWAAGMLGSLFGSSTGAGIGFAIFIGGILSITVGIAGYVIAKIREIEDRMPDFESN
ncbi:MAG: MFS transporter [Anaerolineales bacterium]|nr:MAG: MFS transporter [Anaerolineales bacterium]